MEGRENGRKVKKKNEQSKRNKRREIMRQAYDVFSMINMITLNIIY